MYSSDRVTSLQESSNFTIRVAQIALPSGISGPHAITCEEGLIASITPISSNYDDVLLSPGFIDLQVNGIGEIDVSCAHDNDWQILDQGLLQQGVTTWFPTLMSAPLTRYPEYFRQITLAQLRTNVHRPTIAGIHLEGPYLGDAIGAHDPRLVLHDNPYWFSAIPDNVRIVTIAPENAATLTAIKILRERNVVVSIGHTLASDERTLAAIDAGAQLVTHLFNAMSGIHHRHDGVALVALTDDRVAVSLIADLVHVQPRAINLAFRAKPEGVVLITDSVAYLSPNNKRRGMILRDGAPRFFDDVHTHDTLAGSSLAMNEAIKNVTEMCSIDLHSAIQAATATPARLLGLSDRGAIAVGRRADLVALDQAYAVRHTWLGGQLVLSRH